MPLLRMLPLRRRQKRRRMPVSRKAMIVSCRRNRRIPLSDQSEPRTTVDEKVEVAGNVDSWKTMTGVSGEGVTDAVYGMEVPGGAVLRHFFRGDAGCASSMLFVPGVWIVPDVYGGHKLSASKAPACSSRPCK